MRCAICKKEADQSTWDKIRLWILHHVFSEDIQDLIEDKFTKGFGEGYLTGFKHVVDDKLVVNGKKNLDEILKRWSK